MDGGARTGRHTGRHFSFSAGPGPNLHACRGEHPAALRAARTPARGRCSRACMPQRSVCVVTLIGTWTWWAADRAHGHGPQGHARSGAAGGPRAAQCAHGHSRARVSVQSQRRTHAQAERPAAPIRCAARRLMPLVMRWSLVHAYLRPD
jgi:hypothetical protein